MLKWIKRVCLRLFSKKEKSFKVNFGGKQELESRSAESLVIDLPKPVEQRDAAWFNKRNNLSEQFGYTPQLVYSSVFGDDENPPKPIGYILADGTIVTDLKSMTVVEQQEDELLADGEYNKDEPNYTKPNLDSGNTFYITEQIKKAANELSKSSTGPGDSQSGTETVH